MIEAAAPEDEEQRLNELLSYDVLDTEAERLFDDLTQLASVICDTPIALISLIDPDRQWFKSKVGLNASETSRNISFCSHAILQREVFEISNAKEDHRFHDNPLVAGEPNIRFYAGAPLVTPSGHAIGTLCAISDKPKTLTQMQRHALKTLSQSVVAHLELRRKNRELTRTSQFKSDFLSYISHEIRTPLNAIITFSHLLEGEAKEYSLPTKFIESLGHISKSGERLLEIVNSVLDIKQIEAGKMRVMPRPVHSSDFFTHLFSLSRIRAQEGNVIFTSVIEESVPDILNFDDTKFGQVALNLLSNAIKYTHANKHVFVQVKYKQGKLLLIIKDEGIGISTRDQEKLFAPFERMENAHQFDGTGLGLNITKKLIELMNGSIKLRSTLNEGTQVNVSIPAAQEDTDNTVLDAGTREAEKLMVPNGANILVVEDHYINQVVIKTIFEKLGLPLAIVGTGEEGVEYVKSNPVDVVLMDLNLPGINGQEATRQIKHMRRELPVIALTADVISQHDICLNTGLDAILTKPVESAQLIRVLNKYVGK